MNCLSARVDGRHTGGCHHDHALVGLQWQVLQESGLSRARSSSEEDVGVGEEHQFFDELKFLVSKGLLRHAMDCIHLAKVGNIKQIIHYTSHGCQPEFVYENQVENGKITAWFSKEKTKEVYKTWMNNRPKK